MVTRMEHQFLSNLYRAQVLDKVVPIKMDVIEAANLFDRKSVDLVLLDFTVSDYDKMREAIRAWYPKIKLDGFIGGDDWKNPLIARAIKDSGLPVYYAEDQFWLAKRNCRAIR